MLQKAKSGRWEYSGDGNTHKNRLKFFHNKYLKMNALNSDATFYNSHSSFTSYLSRKKQAANKRLMRILIFSTV